MPGAIINADVRIGRHVIVNTAAVVDHDCRVKDFVHIAQGAVLAGWGFSGKLRGCGGWGASWPGHRGWAVNKICSYLGKVFYFS